MFIARFSRGELDEALFTIFAVLVLIQASPPTRTGAKFQTVQRADSVWIPEPDDDGRPSDRCFGRFISGARHEVDSDVERARIDLEGVRFAARFEICRASRSILVECSAAYALAIRVASGAVVGIAVGEAAGRVQILVLQDLEIHVQAGVDDERHPHRSPGRKLPPKDRVGGPDIAVGHCRSSQQPARLVRTRATASDGGSALARAPVTMRCERRCCSTRCCSG